MKRGLATALAAALIVGIPALPVQADSISSVEGARAKERSGLYLNRQDREKLRRYGSNDDGYNSHEPYASYRFYGYDPRVESGAPYRYNGGYDDNDGYDDDGGSDDNDGY